MQLQNGDRVEVDFPEHIEMTRTDDSVYVLPVGTVEAVVTGKRTDWLYELTIPGKAIVLFDIESGIPWRMIAPCG